MPQTDRTRLDFPVNALDVVLMGAYGRTPSWRRLARADRDAARAALDRVGLADRARRRFGALSGGQRQRVLIARALLQDSPVMLLDEPLSGVDAASAARIDTVFEELRAEGRVLLVATHDVEQARRWDRVVCLNGEQVAFGAPAEVLTTDVLRQHLRRRAGRAGGRRARGRRRPPRALMLDWLLDPFSGALMQRALVEVLIVAVACGPLGVWVLLYRQSYAAESISHAMLPGLVVAALAGAPLLLGAAGGVIAAAVAIALAGRDERLGGDVGVAVAITRAVRPRGGARALARRARAAGRAAVRRPARRHRRRPRRGGAAGRRGGASRSRSRTGGWR